MTRDQVIFQLAYQLHIEALKSYDVDKCRLVPFLDINNCIRHVQENLRVARLHNPSLDL